MNEWMRKCEEVARQMDRMNPFSESARQHALDQQLGYFREMQPKLLELYEDEEGIPIVARAAIGYVISVLHHNEISLTPENQP